MVQMLRRRPKEKAPEIPAETVGVPAMTVDSIPIPPGDPLETYLIDTAAPVQLDNVDLDSSVLEELRGAGVSIVVPLVGQGELLGALYLGPRLSDQPYSTDDRKLLANLASQVAPAMRVAQLVRQQQIEAKERERIQQELEVAALIQHTLLPRELPQRSGWGVDAFYRPARAVGGDFYDFIDLSDGRLGVVIGDVTDKGVPAALVMATCRSMLRAAAARHDTPGAVLADVNDALVDEIPPAMFVTCLYATLDTESGGMTIANAGHNLPYIRTGDGVIELRATGMPLGLMSGMEYEERQHDLRDGDVMVLTSDGITEAHDPNGEMYGFSRLLGRVAAPVQDGRFVAAIVDDVERHTGPHVEQEDDITLVVVRRTDSARHSAQAFTMGPEGSDILATFSVSSEEGNERIAIDKVSALVADLGLEGGRLERLETAVGETVMNAIEHGNHFDSSLDVVVEVATTSDTVVVRVTDHGGDEEIPKATEPDLEAKLAGEQTPRGWGLFLIDQMADEVTTTSLDGMHTVEFVINKTGEN
ncbi:MAG: SpoIIE family protein phosphatase [Acidimicrobiia bacterium]|nr:SpoIIE family protein phosphatase [Acidimicrobiia bacterium]